MERFILKKLLDWKNSLYRKEDVLKHKKRIIVAVVVVLVIVTSVILAVGFKEKTEKVPVKLCHWDDENAEYTVCEIVGEVSYSNVVEGDTATFTTDMTLEEIIETNLEDFIEMREMNYFFEHHEAAIFYDDNNYYYILEKEPGTFEAANLWANWHVDGLWSADINFPFPDHETFFDGMTETGKEVGCDIIGDIFELYDFEFFEEFYSRLSEDLYTIDEENQIITVKAYGNTNNVSWEGGMKYEIVIDCANRTITGPMRDGRSATIYPVE